MKRTTFKSSHISTTKMSVSIIIPAYNEEKRLPIFLKNVKIFLKNLNDYEVLLINDGSIDKTFSTMQKLKGKNNNIKIISYEKNRGKGGAIKVGIEHSQKEKIIFIDADGSIQPNQIPHMVEKLDHFDVVCGNRASKYSQIKQPLLRQYTGKTFNNYVNLLFNNSIQDHLCGFKGFKRTIAKELFKNLQNEHWIFDVELFYRIRKKKYTLYLLPLPWEHKEGSKITLFAPIKMAVDLVKLRWNLRHI